MMKIYHLHPNYLRLTIWSAGRAGYREAVLEVLPSKGLTRRQRYDCLCVDLKEQGFICPAYRPSKRDAK